MDWCQQEKKRRTERERERAKDYGLVFRATGCLMNLKMREKRPTEQRRESLSPKTQLLTRKVGGEGGWKRENENSEMAGRLNRRRSLKIDSRGTTYSSPRKTERTA